MNARITQRIRSQRTLLAHELREQGPLGLVLLAAGVAILLGVRMTSAAEPGELRAQLPILVPGLAAVLLAFPAADFFGRDVSSGLARTFAAAPIGRVRILAPRLGVFALVAAVITVVLGALEPVHWFGGRAPSSEYLFAFVPLFVFVALSGAWLRSAAAALVAGTLVYCASSVGLAVASQRRHVQEADLAAMAGVFAEAFKGSLSFAMLVPSGLAALMVAAALRGPRARQATCRFFSACGAALLFVAPPTLSAAFATFSTIDVAFDDPEARVEVWTNAGPGDVLLRLHSKDGPWSSAWVLDPDTGAHERIHDWRGFVERRINTGWRAEPMRASGEGVEARLALANGLTTDWTWMCRASWPGLTSPRDSIVYISAASTIEVVSLIDGSTTTLLDVPEVDFVLGLRLSTDGRWLALDDWVRSDPTDPQSSGFHRVRLIDTRSSEVVQSIDDAGFLGWLSGPQVMAVDHAPRGVPRAGPRYLAVGPQGCEPILVDEDVLSLMPLDERRFVGTTYDDRVVVLGGAGTVERTLRAPKGR